MRRTRSQGPPEFNFHLELERTLREARRRVEFETMADQQENNQNQGDNARLQGERPPPQPRLFGDAYRPRFGQQVVQEIDVDNYQIPPSLVNLVQ